MDLVLTLLGALPGLNPDFPNFRPVRSHRSAILWIVMFTALFARNGGGAGAHQISLVGYDGAFKFYADELSDGTHTYETTYVSEYWWYLAPQQESGRLSDKDWRILKSLRRCKEIPQADDTQLDDPNETWGTMQRGGETIDIRYAEWWALETTQVPASFHSMVFKAKNSL